MAELPGADATLAEKLVWLFDAVRAPSGDPYTYEEIGAFSLRRTGETFATGLLTALRRGDNDDPSMRHLQVLAEFFAVTAGSLFDGYELHRLAKPRRPRADDLTLAQKLTWLFEHVRRENGRPYSGAAVAAWCATRSGKSFSTQLMSALRAGTSTNPSRRRIEAIAAFFQIPPGALFPGSEEWEVVQAEHDLAQVLRTLDPRTVTARALRGRMTAAELRRVASVLGSLAGDDTATDPDRAPAQAPPGAAPE